MTEETPKKKPRKKRRTKAQIEAEKAAEAAKQSKLIAEAEAAAEKEIELQFGSSYEEEIDAIIEEEALTPPVVEEPAASVKKPEYKNLPEYIPRTGMSKLRQKMQQRRLRDQYYDANK